MLWHNSYGTFSPRAYNKRSCCPNMSITHYSKPDCRYYRYYMTPISYFIGPTSSKHNKTWRLQALNKKCVKISLSFFSGFTCREASALDKGNAFVVVFFSWYQSIWQLHRFCPHFPPVSVRKLTEEIWDKSDQSLHDVQKEASPSYITIKEREKKLRWIVFSF